MVLCVVGLADACSGASGTALLSMTTKVPVLCGGRLLRRVGVAVSCAVADHILIWVLSRRAPHRDVTAFL